MRWLFLPVLWCCLPLFAAPPGYIFSEQADPAPFFTDSLGVFVEEDAQYTIEEVRHFADAKFKQLETISKGAPLVLWCRVRLTNANRERFDGYFRTFTFVDSIWMYTVQGDSVVDVAFTGNVLKPSRKSLSANENNLPFSLYAGETKTYYFKLRYDHVFCRGDCLWGLRVIPAKRLVKQQLMSNTLQAFYAGVMLLFGLVSIFLYAMFRESVFIWFALMMFSFLTYFASLHGLMALWFDYHVTAYERNVEFLIISAIILSATFFISTYLDLPSRSPRLYFVHAAYGVFLAVLPYPLALFNSVGDGVSKVFNLLILTWILFGIGITVWAAWRKERPALILLTSLLVLSLGALLFILSMFGLLPATLGTAYAFQTGSLLFSGILFYGVFDKINTIRAEKEQFQELDQLKSRFFANISHEFRTPLTLVMGPIKDVINHTSAPEDRNLLQLAYQNAERLLALINQLLDLSKLEARKMELLVTEQNFAALLKGITMSFESLAKRKDIRLHFVAQQEHILLYVDRDKVEKIFYNLLSNAFKFTAEHGEIAVMITAQKDRVEVIVRDTGVGIPPARLPHIFNRFFQGESGSYTEQEGTGIGLALVQELVKLHRGKIEVDSKVGLGTTFTLSFLTGKAHFDPDEIKVLAPTAAPLKASTSPQEWGAVFQKENQPVEILSYEDQEDKEAPVVLIIEDNAAVRTYIKQHLISTFQVVESTNGEEGIEKALEILPDLIISDVMMPKKDGYEVCEVLKTDQRSSHIPIILLTAKAAPEEKMKGLETGADDYLLKPFDARELAVRSQNLVRSRLALRQKFSATNQIDPQAVGTNSVDKAFLEKICTCIETNLSDQQFGVDVLAQEVGLSRSQLNRKLKALTDQTTNKFIQSFRLQKARELLLAKAGNVSEVAMQTGFNSTAYFVKCFGDKYGVTPGSLL